MALIICPECGNKISDKAKCCIHCGYPLEEMQKEAQAQTEGKECYWEVDPEDIHTMKDEEGVAGPELSDMTEVPAFIKCPVCGKEVSSKTYDCPECGHPLNERPGISFGMVLGAVVLGILLLSIF